jgi:hypothetical protein
MGTFRDSHAPSWLSGPRLMYRLNPLSYDLSTVPDANTLAITAPIMLSGFERNKIKIIIILRCHNKLHTITTPLCKSN